MKKATMKDIAEKANVSTATVSYIINNLTTQTIPHETRERVLRIARELNYVPNLAARSLVKQKSGMIGILLNRKAENGYWRDFAYSEFIRKLERHLTGKGFHVLLYSMDAEAPSLEIITERKLDGVFLIDVREEEFYTISQKFQVPLVLIDSLIPDPLFYKIAMDFESAVKRAKAFIPKFDFLVMDCFNNEGMRKALEQSAGVSEDHIHLVTGEDELKLFIEGQSGKKGLFTNEFLGLKALDRLNPKDIVTICSCGCPMILPEESQKVMFTEDKASAAFDVMMQLIQGKNPSAGRKYVMLKAE
ncbi:LacI family DNA-binding transcriptional regulator [Peribacillus sp. SCS-26]|uniref:LacI family DNA-binding transcriptional regulator n=1 Tax=Paraperibacillus marinus TaxID=3115295 RepID=UPI0039069CF2